MAATVRVGVIGLGSMGRHHARVIRATAGMELVAVADPVGDKFDVAGDLAVLPDVDALISAGLYRTALLPGGATTTLIGSGPFARSRNPLYVGLLVLSAGLALLAGSLWALAALPIEWALLRWGAVLAEERYLAAKFGTEYADYCGRVRRWL